MSTDTAHMPRTALGAHDVDALATAIRHGSIGAFEARSPFAACLMAVLDARGWRGTRRTLSEVLPHFASDLNLASLCNVLADLGFRTIERPVKEQDDILDKRLLPCIFIDELGKPCVLGLNEAGERTIFDPQTRQWSVLRQSTGPGLAVLIAEIEDHKDPGRPNKKWTMSILRRLKPRIWRLLGMTFLLNVLALVGPLFIMAVYDQVITSSSGRLLLPLGLGLLLATAIELATRYVRSKGIAYLGGRLEYLVSRSVFQQILSLPITRTESAPLSGQISRIREFDSMREMFVGTLVSVMLELPYILMFLAVIGILAGWVVLIPVFMLAVFGLLALFMVPALKRSVARSSSQRSKQYRFLIEFVTNLRTIREAGAGEKWVDRFRQMSAETSLAQFQNGQMSFLLQTFAHTIMMFAGGATIVAGVIQVLNGNLSAGGLIAVMALVWRVLSPIQNLFLTMTRAEQIRTSLSHLDQLMLMPIEHKGQHSSGITRQWGGAIDFTRVSFRYQPTADPALLGMSFRVRPREMIAIMGPNGSGKSTILRLIAGLYQAQAGQVSIDGLDVRQIDPQELRQQIAYVPQQPHIFHGTIAQNLRLSNPVASDEELTEACRKASLWEEIEALPDGLETRIGDQTVWQLNAGFRQRLSLARAYLRDASLFLLDEPAQALDENGDRALIEALEGLKGEKTVIMVSHRPSHIKMADRIFRTDGGILIQDATPDEIYAQPEGAPQ